MKKILYLTVLVLFASILTTSAQEWQTMYAQAVQNYEANDYDKASATAENALQTYLKEDGSLSNNYGSILRLLQNISYANGNIAKALEYATKELSVREGKKDVTYAGALTQQAIFYQTLGNYEQAASSYKSAVEILKDFYQPSDVNVVEARVGHAINLYLLEKTEEAFVLFEDVMTFPVQEKSYAYVQGEFYYALLLAERGNVESALEKIAGVKKFYEDAGLAETQEYAAVVMNMGICQHDLRQYQQAENSYSAASAILEKLNIRDGDYQTLLNARAINYNDLGQGDKADQLFKNNQTGSQDGATFAIYLSNKASINTAKGEYKLAEQQYREALSKLDRTKKEHADVYADVIQNLAVLLDEQGKLSDAEKLLRDAATSYASTPHLTSINVNLANVLTKQGKHVEAVQLYRSVLSNAVNNRSMDMAKAMAGLGLVWLRTGELKSADSVYAALLQQYEQNIFPENITYATALNNFAAVKQTNGEVLLARKLLSDAATFARSRNGVMNVGYARALENLGYIDLQIGSLVSAKSEIDSAVLLYQKLTGEHTIPYALALITQGTYHQHAGEYALAEPLYKRAFKIISTNPDASAFEWIRSANALAVFYQTMGNYDQAETLLKQIKDKSEKSLGKASPEYSTSLQNLATLYQLQGKISEAGPMLEEALVIDKKAFGENHPEYIIGLRNLAALYQKTGKMDKALILLEQALASTRNIFGENHPSYASTVSNLAALYQDLKKMPEAEKAWKQSVSIRKNVLGESHPDYARSLYGLASVYFAQGKFTEANANFKIVIEQYLKQIREYFPFLSEKEKGAFYQKIKPVFDAYQDFCIQYKTRNPDDQQILKDLYNTQLATKAILLNSSNKVRQTILSSGDTALVTNFRRWLTAKENIVKYYSLSVEERKQFEPIEVLRQKANDLEKSLSLSSSLFKSQFSDKEYNTASISTLLKPGEAATEIIRITRKYVADSVYYVALTLTQASDEPSMVIWPYGSKLETRLFKFHRNAIKFHYEDTISYRHYWRPLGKSLQSISKVYLSADGIFNKINFNILENHLNGRSVIDDYTIHLLSNTKEIVEQSKRTASPYTNVNLYGYVDFHMKLKPTDHVVHNNTSLTRAFGFDGEIPVLPGTDKEVNFIQDLFKTKNYDVVAYKGAEASEANIKKTPKVKVLHIATHGFFMNDIDVDESQGDDAEDFFTNPLLRSGILLAGAGVDRADVDLQGEDGILTAYEAMNVDLNETDLVVLSACETALGELRNGEGVYGLQRSFIVAGAGGVMMSLWQVDDIATQELMINFYQLWLGGESKHEAFRKAQLMIKEKYQSPYYWGAFILVGH